MWHISRRLPHGVQAHGGICRPELRASGAQSSTYGISRAPGRLFRGHAGAQIFFLAGMETTAHAATWVLFQLSQHPEAEAAVERELDAAGLLVTAARPTPRSLEHADLTGLIYLQAVIKARMRLWPMNTSAAV